MGEPTLQTLIEAAHQYEALYGPISAQFAAKAVDIVQIQNGHRLLDVACGTGILTREVELLERHGRKDAADAVRAPFVLGNRSELTALFESAGADSVDVTTHRGTGRFPSIRVMVEAELRGWLPLGGIVLPEELIEQILREAEDVLRPYVNANGNVSFEWPALIVTAGK